MLKYRCCRQFITAITPPQEHGSEVPESTVATYATKLHIRTRLIHKPVVRVSRLHNNSAVNSSTKGTIQDTSPTYPSKKCILLSWKTNLSCPTSLEAPV